MDKNMINIDDLLKERLANGEETPRPGAWLQMRELLDKEMPVNKIPVTSFNGRRMFGYAAALVLLSVIAIGGYQMVSSERPASKAAYDSIVPQPKETSGIINNNTDNKTAQNTNTLGDTSNPLRDNANTDHITDAHTAGTLEMSQSIAAANNTNTVTNDKNNTAPAVQKTTKNNKTAPANTANNEIASEDKLLNNKSKNALIASINSDNKAAPVITETTNHNKSQQNTPVANDRQFSSSTNAAKAAGESSKPNAVAGNTPAKHNEAAATTNNNKQNNQPANPQASGKSGKKPVSNNVNPDYLVAKQLVPTIEVRQTYDRKEGWKFDTSKGQAEMEILVPAEKKPVDIATVAEKQNHVAVEQQVAKRTRPMITVREEDNIATSPILPSASLSANAENAKEALVPLENFKVSSKQSGNYARTSLIEQMVKNAKMNLGSAKFYGGIIGGLNTSLSGNNSMWGFQVGLSGTLSLNERWGIVSELKYLHRFNSQPLRNDGYANLDSTPPVNGVVTYTWDSVNRSFKFPTVSAMELPVYIRYSLNRLNFHAGMNLTYNFTINNIDIDSFGIRMRNNEGPAMEGAVNYSFQDGVPRIAVEDFASRFSMGYLLGVGYQFTPAIQLDVRMTRPFWDNAKTDGAKEVSKRLYDVPSVQVNLNYRFGNNKFKPYHRGN